MKNKVTISISAVIIFLSMGSTAQTWSAQQQELVDVLTQMAETINQEGVDGLYKFIHPDLVWWNTSNAVPGDYETAKLLDTATFSRGRETLAGNCTPLTIQVYETFAITNSYCRSIADNGEGKDPELVTIKRHFVWKKEGDEWLMVSNFQD